MEIVVRPRRAGKTTECVDWVREGEKQHRYPFWTRVLVVPYTSEAMQLVRHHHLDRYQVFSYEDWRKNMHTAHDVAVAIDNADDLLRSLVGAHVAVASFNQDARATGD